MSVSMDMDLDWREDEGGRSCSETVWVTVAVTAAVTVVVVVDGAGVSESSFFDTNVACTYRLDGEDAMV